MKRLFVAVRATVFGGAFVWFWGWMAVATSRLEPLGASQLPAWAAPVGLVALTCGVALAFSCVALFVVRGEGTPAPFDAPRVFVVAGPYRIVRNPMYIGGWLMLTGLALVERSIAMLAFALVWIALAHLFVITYEEPTLHARFGASYDAYRRRVRRWMPRKNVACGMAAVYDAQQMSRREVYFSVENANVVRDRHRAGHADLHALTTATNPSDLSRAVEAWK